MKIRTAKPETIIIPANGKCIILKILPTEINTAVIKPMINKNLVRFLADLKYNCALVSFCN